MTSFEAQAQWHMNTPLTGKSVVSDDTYVMQFKGDRIRHMTKIWNICRLCSSLAGVAEISTLQEEGRVPAQKPSAKRSASRSLPLRR